MLTVLPQILYWWSTLMARDYDRFSDLSIVDCSIYDITGIYPMAGIYHNFLR